MTTKTITIDPVTRLEGHGRIAIYLDDEGNVRRALFQVPELRGFEAFSVGRPAVDMPQITSRICGVCPMAHHMAATKALDDLYQVQPTPAARAIRELAYCAFLVEDHALHFYFLGAPDFVVGPQAPASARNILGVIGVVGKELGTYVIAARKRLRSLVTLLAGKPIHPVFGVPGGVARPVREAERADVRLVAAEAVAFARKTLDVFHEVVLANPAHVGLISGGAYTHKTHYMGLVDEQNRLAIYDGQIRVVDPEGKEKVRFDARDYARHLGEHVEDWTYIKFPYLREPGWKGFSEGPDSGVYRVAPLARLNAADAMATPLAEAERQRMFDLLGGRPCHHTLANHWARLIEMLYGAERMVELADDPVLTLPDVQNTDLRLKGHGVSVIEAPRGTLIHEYRTDDRGLMTACNLVVSTVHNAASICMSIEKAASTQIRNGHVDEGILNLVEMAFRAYDPCLSCATHSLPGQMPLRVEVFEARGEILWKAERR